MDKDIEKRVAEILGSWSQKKLAYETKRATKKGFATVEEYVASKLKPVRTQEKSTERDTLQTPIWKKTNPDGTPRFDIHALIKAQEVTEPTKEMFEWFLLDYGARDPDTFSYEYDIHRLGETTGGFYACWLFFTEDHLVPRPKRSKYGRNDWSEWFRELQYTISNDKMFWVLFEKFYVENERSLNIDELNKSNRLKVELEERIRVYDKMNRAEKKPDNFGKNYASQLDRLNQYKDDDYLTVYRSFSVQKGKPVRKGVTRLSEEGGVHMEGRGISYTFSKFQACRLGLPINTHTIKKHCKVNDREAAKILRKYWVNEEQAEYIELYDGFYRAIGMFKVKKKDILLCTDTRLEDEVIANPEDVTLIDYKFLNSFHLAAVAMMGQTVWGIQNRNEFIAENNDDVYDLYYASWRNLEKQHPGITGDLLSWSKPEETAKKWREFTYDWLQIGELSDTTKEDWSVEQTMGATGGISFAFCGLVFSPKKTTKTLYQPRVFQYTRVGNTARKPFAIEIEKPIGKVPEKTWYDPTPEYPSVGVSNLSFLSK